MAGPDPHVHINSLPIHVLLIGVFPSLYITLIMYF